MNRKLGLFTLLYGILLASAGATASALKLAPDNTLALYAGIGGGLCMLWGVLGIIGFRSVLGAGITLGVMAFWLVSRTVIGWLDIVTGKEASVPLTLAATVLLGGAIALLVMLMPKDEGPCVPASEDSHAKHRPQQASSSARQRK